MLIRKKISLIDLFAGAGGLSEGFIQAGFTPIAHVEMNPNACKTLETRSVYHALKKNNSLKFYYQYEKGEISREELFLKVSPDIYKTVINKEMSAKSLPGIFDTIDEIKTKNNIDHVDVIIGGPPCQAYSLVGRAQTKHMKKPMEEDPRNELYKMYASFLDKYKPKMFVFENVQGITSARRGNVFLDIQDALHDVGYNLECHLQNAQDFGVLQNRKRMIIIGWKKGSKYFYPQFRPVTSESVVNDLFSDLPVVERGTSNNVYGEPFSQISDYVRRNKLRTSNDILTCNEARPNTDRDVEIYRRTIEAWNDGHRRLHYDELPGNLKTHRNRTSFIDRFKVVEGDLHCCHTVLAHLSKDGHYFIHPDIKQCRSITVREAARLQSFPDSYFFEGNRTSQFTQIGNAVPPLMAEGIAFAIKQELEAGEN